MKSILYNAIAVLSILLFFQMDSYAQSKIYIRKSAHKQSALADIKSLEEAMNYMKNNVSCDSVRGWYYQGAIHDVPSTISGSNQLCASYNRPSEKKIAWSGCPHRGNSQYHFLIWHRLYIWHFEKIVRAISKNKDFALPYWDYTDPNFRTMPPAFLKANSSLYTKSRLQSLNQGNSIGSEVDLNTTPVFRNKNFRNFSAQLDADIHGAVHSYTGGGYAIPRPVIENEITQTKQLGLMASVNTAGFDPIFWVHHSKIDYLWRQWEQNTNIRPDLNELKRVNWDYTFFEPNGKRITYTVEEAYNKAMSIDYTYEGLQNDPLIASAANSSVSNNSLEFKASELTQEKKTVSLIDQKVGKKMADDKMTINLSFSKAVKNKARINMLTESAPNQPPMAVGRMILTVNIEFDKEPTALYEVYFNSNKIDQSKKAGKLSFFGVMHGHDQMDHDMGKVSRDFKFDVTEEYSKGDVSDNIKLFLARVAGSEENAITISSVKLDVVKDE